MAKFVYKMQNILNIKIKLETQAKNVYAAANRKYLEEQEILQELMLRRVGYEKKLKELMNGNIDIKAVTNARNDVNTMKTIVRRQMVEVHKAEKAVETARNELNRIIMERKTQEKLKEKDFEKFKEELKAEEAKEIDQLVSFTYNDK